jgi:hypothetical protein
MLRRKPTAITLTSEDVMTYESSRTSGSSKPTGSNGKPGAGPVDPNDELKPLPGDKARVVRAGAPSREDRIVGR